jgi:hypothetical protein
MPKKSQSPQYHKFAVVDSARRVDKARVGSDAASPSLEALQSKLGVKRVDAGKLGGQLKYKRAVPKSKVLDGSASSRRLLVKGGKIIGAQG